MFLSLQYPIKQNMAKHLCALFATLLKREAEVLNYAGIRGFSEQGYH